MSCLAAAEVAWRIINSSNKALWLSCSEINSFLTHSGGTCSWLCSRLHSSTLIFSICSSSSIFVTVASSITLYRELISSSTALLKGCSFSYLQGVRSYCTSSCCRRSDPKVVPGWNIYSKLSLMSSGDPQGSILAANKFLTASCWTWKRLQETFRASSWLRTHWPMWNWEHWD